MASTVAIFIASLRSVGTATTLAAAGFYMDRRNFIQPGGKKTLALLSQQVTIPAFLFSKIVYCPQDKSPEPCPSFTDDLRDIWMLLFLPLFVVGCGLLVGWAASKLSSTPARQKRSVMAAVAFGNSTGLPITLLTVIQANFPPGSDIGHLDSTLYLSVYLLLYPVLQWGIGGWLLAPVEDESNSTKVSIRHILNPGPPLRKRDSSQNLIRELSMDNMILLANPEVKKEQYRNLGSVPDTESSRLLGPSTEQAELMLEPSNDILPLTSLMRRVVSKSLQPPVIGALLGMTISAIVPLRGLLVDLRHRSDSAPLEWLFDGVYAVGQAAVPINMCILGANLSQATKRASKSSHDFMSSKTMFSVVVAKMVVMPIIGIISAEILYHFLWHVPRDIDGAFYLVLMIVFITPTANNVMVMVELSGSGSKEGMARLIAWQYAVAPVLLSLTVALVVGVASKW